MRPEIRQLFHPLHPRNMDFFRPLRNSRLKPGLERVGERWPGYSAPTVVPACMAGTPPLTFPNLYYIAPGGVHMVTKPGPPMPCEILPSAFRIQPWNIARPPGPSPAGTAPLPCARTPPSEPAPMPCSHITSPKCAIRFLQTRSRSWIFLPIAAPALPPPGACSANPQSSHQSRQKPQQSSLIKPHQG